MRREAVREGHERVDDDVEAFAWHAGVDRRLRGDVFVLEPGDRCRFLRLCLDERVFEPRAEVFERELALLERQVAAVHERLGVELAHRATPADHLVHARLRERGLVAFVVAVPPVADHVDDDVLLELLPEREREADDAHRRFRVVAVHVEDRRLHRLGDVGGVHGRTPEVGRRREADLVVDDDVHGAADVVAGQLREVQRLRDDALAGERGVAVDEHREHLLVRGVVGAVLLGADHAFDDRVDGFEVARVRGERQVGGLARARGVLARRADVVLHVARALRHVRVELAFELAEDLAVRLPDDVREHVEAAAVRHAHHDLLHPGVGGFVEEELQHRDERLAAFEAEALLPEVLRVEEALERLGRVERGEDLELLVRRRVDVHALRTGVGSTPSRRAPGCACTRRRSCASTRRAARRGCRGAACTRLPARPPVGNSRSRSQIVRPQLIGSSSSCVRGSFRPSGSRFAIRCPRTRYMLIRPLTASAFSTASIGSFERLVVATPSGRLVRHAEAGEDVRVEVVLAEQQLVHAAEELAALGALDDAMVVGARERDDLADADLGERLRVGAFELDRVGDRADADDRALARHQARHRVHRADRARVGDRHRRAGEVVDRELVRARLADQLLVRGVERGEVERVRALDVRDEQRARAVVLLQVDREAEVHVRVPHDRRACRRRRRTTSSCSGPRRSARSTA